MNDKLLGTAILKLVEKAKFVIIDGKIIWKDERPQPSDEEIQAKIKELEAEEVKKQIEQRATNFVKKQLKELDYDNEGEVALYAANSKSQWNKEAKALQVWIESVYQKMYELQEQVTIENYKNIDLDKIEAEYPAFKA